MKKLFLLTVVVAFIAPAIANAHGGGCRKSSPAGMCCHMETKTGIVHCH